MQAGRIELGLQRLVGALQLFPIQRQRDELKQKHGIQQKQNNPWPITQQLRSGHIRQRQSEQPDTQQGERDSGTERIEKMMLLHD